MTTQDLRSQSIEEVLSKAGGLSSVATPEQVRSILTVVARCTIDVGENLQSLSGEVKGASTALATDLN